VGNPRNPVVDEELPGTGDALVGVAGSRLSGRGFVTIELDVRGSVEELVNDEDRVEVVELVEGAAGDGRLVDTVQPLVFFPPQTSECAFAAPMDDLR